jgi:iron complex transport system substrate-binding protein
MIRLFAVIIVLLPRLVWASDGSCERIVSLAPSVTEVLYDVDLGERVVGVTRYCRYPEAAQKLPNIGGFYDMSVESIVALKPTLVVALAEHESVRRSLENLGVSTLAVDHTTPKGIKESFQKLGARCGVETEAAARVEALERREAALRFADRVVPPLRALVVVGRANEGSPTSSIYVSGNDGFYSGILELLGVLNVNNDATMTLPTLSPEGLLALKPDVILEVVGKDDPAVTTDRKQLWARYPQLPAVRNNRILVLDTDYATIPGPRYVQLAEDVHAMLRGTGAR